MLIPRHTDRDHRFLNGGGIILAVCCTLAGWAALSFTLWVIFYLIQMEARYLWLA
ncbi:hypothetical protein SAMN06273572_10221 [Monaibacterium marinum]|uniref:Uncharacterized protein n=1 Tax=Pontivivens marinum TaxID=1690039 RepID=A0A2C9CQ82_9RHOB|nr:hypothetical protein SAMN06273572_10221 [Monaibacterium marinum]